MLSQVPALWTSHASGPQEGPDHHRNISLTNLSLPPPRASLSRLSQEQPLPPQRSFLLSYTGQTARPLIMGLPGFFFWLRKSRAWYLPSVHSWGKAEDLLWCLCPGLGSLVCWRRRRSRVHLAAGQWCCSTSPHFAQVTPGRGWGQFLAMIFTSGIQTVQVLPFLGTAASLTLCLL